MRKKLQQKFQQLNKCTYLDFRAFTLPWKMYKIVKNQNRKFSAFMIALNAEMSFSIFVPSCTNCTENPATSPRNLRSFASKSVPKLTVRLLYGFPEICTTKQQSLLDFCAQNLPRIKCWSCSMVLLENCASLPRKMCPTLAVRISALETVPPSCCTDFAEVSISCPLSPLCSEISLALLLSFSQSAHERINDLFLLFLL